MIFIERLKAFFRGQSVDLLIGYPRFFIFENLWDSGQAFQFSYKYLRRGVRIDLKAS